MIIVITGLDGSGTSTIAKKLNELDPNSYIFRTPSSEYSDRKSIDINIKKESDTAHMLYYLSSVVYMSDYIKKHCDYKNKNVYILRYLIDTVVSNRVAGTHINLDYNIYGNHLLEPDLTIFMQVNEDERQKRLFIRGKDSLDKTLDDEQIRNKFLKEFNQLLDPNKTIYVDNNKDINIVAEETLKRIYEFSNK